ncbi:hypothetical protein PV04_01773 [Phialophora macrospora]|uniref:Protein kinase domain-containing protein n=1 Tax=Phialophora macrospora TaxID=1851006 RepID=A0A0D2G4E7_9EURO|nr:hypothetical protein PV04_01773 [Phialophora macrospora]
MAPPTPLQKLGQGPKCPPPNMQTEFDKKVEEFTVIPQCNECSGCGRNYIQVEKLRNWLKEKYSKRPDTTRADLCLEAAMQGHNAGSLSLSDINAPDRECLLVFSILYAIGEPHLIQDFQRWGLTDSKLPISLLELEDELKQGSIPEADRLAKRFDQRQWAFCPARFDWSSTFACKKPTILPICRRGILSKKGGTALLWQIAVQEEFVGPKLRAVSARSKFPDPAFGICYQFVLKTFRDGHAEFFREEREAFWALREHDGMIRYLGDFSHPSDPSCQIKEENDSGESIQGDVTVTGSAAPPGEPVGRMTTNILLEWGEADLEEFLAERQPPVLGSEVRLFWKELFGVAEALQKVHNFINKKNGKEFDGWHADIKPDNILRVHSSFKLSDPGFAKLVPKRPNNTTRISGGTSTYGAPEWERSRKSGEAVPQSIDIWSLGCVFSIAATWVALGYKGVLVYEKVRENAIKERLRAKQHHAPPSQHDDEKEPEADFFHDGSNVLDAIQHWHKAVRQYIRQTDSVTGQVLDLVTASMLRGEPSQRISAADLCKKLTSILDSYPEKPEFGALPDVQKALDEVQTQNVQLQTRYVPEPSSQKEGPIQGRAARDARKSYNVHMARMRSEYFGSPAAGSLSWPSASFSRPKGRASQDGLLTKSDASQGSGLHAHQLRASVQEEGTSHPKRQSSVQATRASTANQRKPLDVFQARYELEEEKRSLSSRFKEYVNSNRRKDPFLAEFFTRRDIIFVADNAGTMVDAWPQAAELLDVLVRKARNLDENGMDLYFTHTNGKPNAVLFRQRNGPLVRAPTSPKLDGGKDVAKFKEAMKMAESKPIPGVKTDMSLMLGFLLDKYITHLSNVGTNKARKQTIIVLTDGKWELVKVSKVIKDFVDKWKGLDRDKIESRSMGIQFVQFGNDPDATLRLEYLDNKLPFEGVPDIVDTEPSLGDVYKMLIGSFIAEYDARSSVPSPGSPGPAPAIMFSEHDLQSSPPRLGETTSLQQIATNPSVPSRPLPSTLERLPTPLDPETPD